MLIRLNLHILLFCIKFSTKQIEADIFWDDPKGRKSNLNILISKNAKENLFGAQNT